MERRSPLELIKLKVEEFCLFSKESRLCIIAMHGRFIITQVIKGKLEVSVYALYEYYVKIVKSVPEFKLLEIRPVNNLQDLLRYLDVDKA